jgi:hypothetical protein
MLHCSTACCKEENWMLVAGLATALELHDGVKPAQWGEELREHNSFQSNSSIKSQGQFS